MSQLMKKIAEDLSKTKLARRRAQREVEVETEIKPEGNKVVECLNELYEAACEGECEEVKLHLSKLASELDLAEQVAFEVEVEEDEEEVKAPAAPFKSKEEAPEKEESEESEESLLEEETD